jgi:hypothetical protein
LCGFDGENLLPMREFHVEVLEKAGLPEESKADLIHSLGKSGVCFKFNSISEIDLYGVVERPVRMAANATGEDLRELCDIQIQLGGQIEGNRQASAPESSRTTDRAALPLGAVIVAVSSGRNAVFPSG